MVFTGHEFAEGGEFISKTLNKENVSASFFLTGDFYRNPAFEKLIRELAYNYNRLYPHSDKHLLYCDWNNRDSLLVSSTEFLYDLWLNVAAMYKFVLEQEGPSLPKHFLPPYEWYNDTIAAWTKDLGFQLINYTPGTLSHADYTTLKDKSYRSSETIYNSIINYEKTKPAGLNGFVLLMHIGAGPDRTDKFYTRLPELIKYLKQKGYQFKTVDQLLKTN